MKYHRNYYGKKAFPDGVPVCVGIDVGDKEGDMTCIMFRKGNEAQHLTGPAAEMVVEMINELQTACGLLSRSNDLSLEAIQKEEFNGADKRGLVWGIKTLRLRREIRRFLRHVGYSVMIVSICGLSACAGEEQAMRACLETHSYDTCAYTLRVG